nr:hypothetical protein [Anaerolineae bacterium]
MVDKDEYEVGDTAEVLIPSPYQGDVKALVTVERGRVIEHEIVDLTSNSQVLRLPIEETFAPNVYVSVVIMKGIDESSPAPTFKMGLAQLKVSTEQKQLTVTVTPRVAAAGSASVTDSTNLTKTLTVAPREKLVWDVETKDASGKGVPADVSLALVDKAVLTLADDPAGSILDKFYAQRALGVQTGVTLVLNIDRLVAQLAEDGKGGGGGDGGGGMEVRTEFPDVAFWRASVSTDAQGKATVEVTLPDNLTTWVMDARAITEDTLVGQSETEVVATKPLLVRPVLPRFFVAGDKADIAAIIHNTTGEDLQINLSAAATGLRLLDADTAKVTVPANSTYKAVWSADASGARLSDAVRITLPVYRYSTPEVVGTAGQVDVNAEALELVRLPQNVDASRGQLDVRVEPSLAAGMVGGLTYLEHYPYECVAQRRDLRRAEVARRRAARSRRKAAAASGRRAAADLREATPRRRLGLVAERQEQPVGDVVHPLRPRQGEAGGLHRGRAGDGGRDAVPPAHIAGAEGPDAVAAEPAGVRAV